MVVASVDGRKRLLCFVQYMWQRLGRRYVYETEIRRNTRQSELEAKLARRSLKLTLNDDCDDVQTKAGRRPA